MVGPIFTDPLSSILQYLFIRASLCFTYCVWVHLRFRQTLVAPAEMQCLRARHLHQQRPSLTVSVGIVRRRPSWLPMANDPPVHDGFTLMTKSPKFCNALRDVIWSPTKQNDFFGDCASSDVHLAQYHKSPFKFGARYIAQHCRRLAVGSLRVGFEVA